MEGAGGFDYSGGNTLDETNGSLECSTDLKAVDAILVNKENRSALVDKVNDGSVGDLLTSRDFCDRMADFANDYVNEQKNTSVTSQNNFPMMYLFLATIGKKSAGELRAPDKTSGESHLVSLMESIPEIAQLKNSQNKNDTDPATTEPVVADPVADDIEPKEEDPAPISDPDIDPKVEATTNTIDALSLQEKLEIRNKFVLSAIATTKVFPIVLDYTKIPDREKRDTSKDDVERPAQIAFDTTTSIISFGSLQYKMSGVGKQSFAEVPITFTNIRHDGVDKFVISGEAGIAGKQEISKPNNDLVKIFGELIGKNKTTHSITEKVDKADVTVTFTKQ